jgi:hypothetical protein
MQARIHGLIGDTAFILIQLVNPVWFFSCAVAREPQLTGRTLIRLEKPQHGQHRSTEKGIIMKIVSQDRYGGSEVLKLEDVDHPAANRNTVLIRVETVAVTAADVLVPVIGIAEIESDLKTRRIPLFAVSPFLRGWGAEHRLCGCLLCSQSWC